MIPPPGRDDRGVVLPSWLVVVSAVAVAMAVVGFAVSGDREPEVTAADSVSSAQANGDAAGGSGADNAREPGAKDERESGSEPDSDQDQRDPAGRRTAYVEVYNNAGITGLADATAATLQDTGWQVVTTDNWYGEIPANTVYSPAAIRDQAELLAGDLGIERVQPAVAPMAFDRLTVILVSGV